MPLDSGTIEEKLGADHGALFALLDRIEELRA